MARTKSSVVDLLGLVVELDADGIDLDPLKKNFVFFSCDFVVGRSFKFEETCDKI